jgi:hypothetical protein
MEQIKIYEKMLKHLKKTEKQPSELELDLLYVVRSLLEEGWNMSKEEFYTIMESININE